MAEKKHKVYRDSLTGHWTTEDDAERRPAETQAETVTTGEPDTAAATADE